MELSGVLAIAWKRRWVVLIVVVAAGIASAAFARSQAKQYESTAVLALTPDLKKGQGPLSSDDLNALMRTYAEMAQGAVIRKDAEAKYGHTLPGPVDAAADAGTGILRIHVRAPQPDTAAAAANAVASAFTKAIAKNNPLSATVVTPPEAPSAPVAPRLKLIIGAALVVGLLCGLLLACALENLRRRIVTAADVAEHTPVPVVGRLPRERALTRKEARTAWDIAGEAPLKEGFRAMRTNLEALLGDSRCLQFTSSEEGEGTSIVVASLGIAFAQVGIDTVILDADLRRPSQHEIFGISNEVGLSTALAYSQKVELEQSHQEGLWVVTSGPVLPDPTENLHIGIRSVIEDLRRLGALILIDTPPVQRVSDARLIAPAVDGVLMVVAAGRQKPAVFRSALEQLKLVDARVIGVVINGSEPEMGAGRQRGGGERMTREPRSSEADGRALPSHRSTQHQPREPS